ncbi:MAG: MFS transporter [Candidatus Bathyarchaeia archaeon]|nr:MFS transporter [Candidatus Bathyarchaeota archaeon]
MRRLAFMVTLNTLCSLGVGLIGPIYPIFILNRFSASIIDVGLLLTIFGFVSALFKAPAGKMIDVYGREKVFFTGAILGSLCSVAYIFTSDILHLYILEFLSGISYALQNPARLTLIVELTSKEDKGLLIGISESIYDIAGSIATLIAVAMVSNLGFESIFFVCSGCQIITGLLVIRYG